MLQSLNRVSGALALLVVLVLLGGLGLYFFYPRNLARRPPELDALRAETLKRTHVEAEFLLETTVLGEPNFEGNVTVVFPHPPPGVDKGELERTARAMVKQHLPYSKEIDVRFGDNLRTRPLEIEKDDVDDGQLPFKKLLHAKQPSH